ncbi:MAG: NUDIX domain-containing protein [Patescibacteria group bacterium]
MERFKLIPEVCFVFIRDGKILLGRRANTGYEDGKYCFPAGHGEEGETMAEGCAREAFEEVGLKVDPKDLTFLHTQYRWSAGADGHARVGFYFAPKVDPGEPKNMEPEKCDDLQWFPLDNLPIMVAPFRAALDAILRGEMYSEFGWETRVK